MFWFSMIAIIIVLIDQIIKFFIETKLFGKSVEIINNIFSLTYLRNNGAAWGIFSENNFILIIITPILILGVMYYLYKISNEKSEKIIGAMVVGGAVGNYIDRLFRGYVVDYIDFKIWPVFNFADICIVLGCIIFIINLIVKEKRNGD